MMAQHNTLNACLKDLLFYRGSGPVLLRNPYFCHFPGGPDPLSPPLNPHMIPLGTLTMLLTDVIKVRPLGSVSMSSDPSSVIREVHCKMCLQIKCVYRLNAFTD